MSVRVLLVDDSVSALGQIENIVTRDLGFDVVGRANHGLQAVDLASALRPDLVTLDVRMPVMDGLTALKHIMSHRPVTTVMVSALTREDAHLTFDCLRCGALDFVSKPSARDPRSPEEQLAEMRDRLHRAATLKGPDPRYCRLRRPQLNTLSPRALPPERLLLISAGRGGVAPLLKFFNDLIAGFRLAAIVALDAPDHVIASFARYLDRFTAFSVSAAENSCAILADTVTFVPSSRPSRLTKKGKGYSLNLQQADTTLTPLNIFTELGESAAGCFRDNLVGVLMSGAGRSSREWLRISRDAGGLGIIQEPATAIEAAVLQSVADEDEVDLCAGSHELAVELGHRFLG